MRYLPFLSLLLAGLLLFSCQTKSPEKLPKFKDQFRTQIAQFESQKEKTDKKVEDGIVGITGLKEALDNAQNVDKEFERVYTKWKRVNNQVENLNKEYEQLKENANNLFDAMERQTESLNDVKTKSELGNAIRTSKQDYMKTLMKTERAIGQLHNLHDEAIDIVKALEVAIALGQIAEINNGLKSIEDRVDGIMAELNSTIIESKDLYEKRIGSF